jgi:hypothetical protein
MKQEKKTEFTGYLSGDYESFCLSKIPFDEWVKVDAENKDLNDELLLYPSDFFSSGWKDKKMKFTIIVKAELVEE